MYKLVINKRIKLGRDFSSKILTFYGLLPDLLDAQAFYRTDDWVESAVIEELNTFRYDLNK